MHSPAIEKLIKLFVKFPTVGPRTASRFVFYLVKTPQEEIEDILQGIKDLKSKIKICLFCFNSFESAAKEDLCPICSDPKRDKNIVCVVEKETDLEIIEKTNRYKGLYFILGGMIANLKKEGEKQKIEKRVAQLIEKLKKEPAFFSPNGAATGELVLALNPTAEGQNTSLWLKRKFKDAGEMKITQLGRGLPIGGELEYADEETLSSALENRR